MLACKFKADFNQLEATWGPVRKEIRTVGWNNFFSSLISDSRIFLKGFIDICTIFFDLNDWYFRNGIDAEKEFEIWHTDEFPSHYKIDEICDCKVNGISQLSLTLWAGEVKGQYQKCLLSKLFFRCSSCDGPLNNNYSPSCRIIRT